MSLVLLTDEDFVNRILRGLRQRLPQLDIVRAQDVGLVGVADPLVLEWADSHGRVLLTHDEATMPQHAQTRLRAGQRVVGVCIIPQSLPIGRAIEELVLVAECTFDWEWESQVR